MSRKSFYRSIDLVNAVTKKLKVHELITKRDRILVSISGGQDSLCLIFLLNQLSDQMELHLVFFWCHHLWQIDSFSLMKQIAKLSFLFQFGSCFTIPAAFIPSELAARNWRQQSSFRVSVFYNYDKIGLAHSANDKIETILLNLIRGTGLTGLSPLRWIQDSSGKITQEHRSSFPFSLVSKFYWSSFFTTVPCLKKDIPDTRKERLMAILPERFNILGFNPPLRSLTRWSINSKKSIPYFFTFSFVNFFYNLSKRTVTTNRVSNSFACLSSSTTICAFRQEWSKGTNGGPAYQHTLDIPWKMGSVPLAASHHHRWYVTGYTESINFLSSFVPLVAYHFSLEYTNMEQFFDCIPFLWNLQNRKKRTTSSNPAILKHVAVQYWTSIVRHSYIKKKFFSFNYRANSLSLKSVKNWYRRKSSYSTSLVFPLLFLERISLHKHIQSFSKKSKNKMSLKTKKESKAKRWFYSISPTLFKSC